MKRLKITEANNFKSLLAAPFLNIYPESDFVSNGRGLVVDRMAHMNHIIYGLTS